MLLKLKDVYFRYPDGVEVLRGVTLSVDRGESVAVIGSNGCGKTTLLMVAAGLLGPEKGDVLLDGRPLKEQLPQARRRIGMVFQDPDDQLFNPTVYEEIAFAPRQLLTPEEVEERVLEIAERFNIRSLLGRPPYKLSMGEKRMVTMASILVYNPELLLLDEPTADLSYTPIKEIKRIILEAKEDGRAVLMASHDLEFVAEVVDRIYILSSGLLYGGSETESILFNDHLLALADINPQWTTQALAHMVRSRSEKI